MVFKPITYILPVLLNKHNSASKKCEEIEKEYPCILPDSEIQPLLRSNAWSSTKPWKLSGHYVNIDDLYPEDSLLNIYCKNYNVQTKYETIKRRLGFWLYVIRYSQEMFFVNGKSKDYIKNYFNAFSKSTNYDTIRCLLIDFDINFTEDLYNKKYELYTNFIDSILESPINWSEYGVENPKCFEEISI